MNAFLMSVESAAACVTFAVLACCVGEQQARSSRGGFKIQCALRRRRESGGGVGGGGGGGRRGGNGAHDATRRIFLQGQNCKKSSFDLRNKSARPE